MAIYRFTAQENAVRREALEKFGVRYLMAYDTDPKTSKSNKVSDQYYSVITYLAPHSIGGWNVCGGASAGCIINCLYKSGNPAYAKGKEKARIARKEMFFRDMQLYEALLRAELNYHSAHAEALGRTLAYRGNGTSDLPWERIFPSVFTDYSNVVFYDYTKLHRRFSPNYALPSNYHLTFSLSETNYAEALEVLKNGGRVAAVFSTARTKALPSEWEGYPVVDQDTDDLTFLREGGQWLGLRAKGPARRDTSGFVIQVR